MLSKSYRLSGKDIQYMLRKGKKIYGDMFVFVICPQYPQRKYIQRSIQIPLKLDKRAVMRNLLKRTARNIFLDIYAPKGAVGDSSKTYKVFIFVNKKSVTGFKDTIATQKKTTIVEEWKEICRKDFTLFFSRVGVILPVNSMTLGSKGKSSGRK